MRAVFLDRDGVINRDDGYVFKREDFEFLPGAVKGMRQLGEAGFALIVVTNQSGIARGFYDEAAFLSLSSWMRDELAKRQVHLLQIYYCPHHPDGVVQTFARSCDCRKPAPGMLVRAQADHGIDMDASIMVGDKPSDILAARAAGVGRAFLIASKGNDSEKADAVMHDLEDCAAHILETSK